MTDPIETLEALPAESPPREAVLASLRLFRYRAFATVLTVAVVVLGVVFVARSVWAVGEFGVNEEVRAVLEHEGVEYRPVSGSAMIGAVWVSVTEVATSPDGSAVRVVFVDTGTPERVVDLDVLAVRYDNGELGPHLSIQSLGRDAGRNSTAVWVPLRPSDDPFGAELEILVLPIPDSILEQGGELSSEDAFTGFVTIERNPSP